MTTYYVIPDEDHEPLTDVYETVLGSLPLAISKTQKWWFSGLTRLYRQGQISAETAAINEYSFAAYGWCWVDNPEKNFKYDVWSAD